MAVNVYIYNVKKKEENGFGIYMAFTWHYNGSIYIYYNKNYFYKCI